MRRIFTLLFIPTLLLCLASVSFAQGTNTVASHYQDTNVIQQFRLLLDFPTNTFTNGETVLCHFGLTNMSETPTFVFPSWFGVDLHFMVTNSNGRQVKPLELDYALQPYGGPERVPPHSPEGCYYGLYPIGDFIPFTPGTYQVCAEREAGSGTNAIIYTSSVVTITILPPPPPKATNNPTPKTN